MYRTPLNTPKMSSKNKQSKKCNILLSALFLIILFQICFAENSEGPLPKEDMDRVKKVYEFDKWEEKVKYPEKEVKNLKIEKDFYANFSTDIKISTPEDKRSKESRMTLVDKKTNSNISVNIYCLDNQIDAHKAMLNIMALSSHPLPAYKKYDPNDPNLVDFREPKDPNLPIIGDICFIPISLWKPKNAKMHVINLLRFSRNNVLVEIRINAPEDKTEYPNLIGLSAIIDEKIISILETKSEK